jgi:hypothetical protein
LGIDPRFLEQIWSRRGITDGGLIVTGGLSIRSAYDQINVGRAAQSFKTADPARDDQAVSFLAKAIADDFYWRGGQQLDGNRQLLGRPDGTPGLYDGDTGY